jgi:hypothetical protein
VGHAVSREARRESIVQESLAYRLENAAGGAKKIDVARLRVSRNLIEPAHRRGFQARFRRVIGRINQFDLDRILAALHPPFSRFTSFVHGDF